MRLIRISDIFLKMIGIKSRFELVELSDVSDAELQNFLLRKESAVNLEKF